MSEISKVKWQVEVPVPLTKELFVREIFLLFHKEFGYDILKTQENFPDYILLDKEGKKIRAEAEINAFDFMVHGHPLEGCDLIICWEDNWKDCKKPRLELSRFVLATFQKFEKEELKGISGRLKQYRAVSELLLKRQRLVVDIERFVNKRNTQVNIRYSGAYWNGSYGLVCSYKDWRLVDHAGVNIDFENEAVYVFGLFEPAQTKKKLDVQGWNEVLTVLEEKNFTFQRKLDGVNTKEEVVDKGKLLEELQDPNKIDYVTFSHISPLDNIYVEPADLVETLGNNVLWILDFLKEKELYTLTS